MLFVFNLGFIAVPLNLLFSNLFSIVFLVSYIIISKSWKKCAKGISKTTFKCFPSFIKLAIPSMFMLCAEWWSYQVHLFVAGTISTPALTSISILFTATAIFYNFSFCYAVVESVIVGNSMGEGNIKKAKSYSRIIVIMSIVTQIFCMFWFYTLREYWPYLFTTDSDVIDILVDVVLIVSILAIIDSAQITIGGILRGVGKQHIGAISYLLMFYLIGIPVGTILALKVGMDTKGQWIGMLLASIFILLVMLLYYIIFLDWNEALEESNKRLFQSLDLIIENNTEIDSSSVDSDEQKLDCDNIV